MNTSSKYDLPWDLIAESLTGNLTTEQELRLQEWLSSAPANKKKFDQVKELWTNGTVDYPLYQHANEKDAWKALQKKIPHDHFDEKKVVKIEISPKKTVVRRIVLVAAVITGIVCLGMWLVLTNTKPVVYETALNEHRSLRLNDGTVMELQPTTKIEVPADYNHPNRTVQMFYGNIFFDIEHQPAKPFIVKMGSTQILDIGTSFTIVKSETEIRVSVKTGKITFVKIANHETKDLSAGSGITFNLQKENFGEIYTSKTLSGNRLMYFNNTPLSDVIRIVQKVYGKKIEMKGDIAQKKLTAQLGGMPYDSALKVICKSLGLEYSVNGNLYLLKEKTKE